MKTSPMTCNNKSCTPNKSELKSQKMPLGVVLKRVLKGYKLHLLLVALCIIITAAASVSSSIFINILVDDIVAPLKGVINPDLTKLITAICIMAGVYLLGIICSFTYTQLMVTIAQGSLNNIRNEMFIRLQSLPVSYFDQKGKGDIMSYFSTDTDSLLHMMSQGIPQLMNTMFTLLAVTIAMFVVSPILACFVLVYAVIMLFIAKTIGSRSAKNFEMQQDAISKVNSFAEEMITGQKVVKVFNQEEKCKANFDKINTIWRDASFRAVRLSCCVGPVMVSMGHLLYVLVAIIGGAMAVNNFANTTIGVIISFLMMSRMFVMPFMQVAEQVQNIALALAGSVRIFGVLDSEPEVDNGYVTLVKAKISDDYKDNVEKEQNQSTDPIAIDAKYIEESEDGEWMWKHPHGDGTLTYSKLIGRVELHNVDFGYVPNKLVLHDINMIAEPGQKIALVGSTGAGKTTITNLINRFYDIDDGKIRYDGININKIKKEDLRKSLGIVLQDVNLFTGTIDENIRYGRRDATREEVIKAAKMANAHDFIETLPNGYDTIIDGDGSNLSQGQRQLLSIARAIIADTPLMILDEATSSIDTRTEVLVQSGMDALMHGRTCFVIAHRLSTIQNADCIMVLEKGRIIERGNHEQLLAKKGRYFELYNGGEAQED